MFPSIENAVFLLGADEKTTNQEDTEEGESKQPTAKLSLTQIRQEAKKKLEELKEKFSLENDFDDLDFGEDDEDHSDIENSEDEQ